MANSLSPKCTPLKQQYDSCFNAWFEGYLEPAVSHSTSEKEHAAFSKAKADEFEAKCGQIWNQYKECVQRAVKEKGLDKLLNQARDEYPLTKPTPPPPQKS